MLTALREDQRNDRWRPEWPPISSFFLDEVLKDNGNRDWRGVPNSLLP